MNDVEGLIKSKSCEIGDLLFRLGESQGACVVKLQVFQCRPVLSE